MSALSVCYQPGRRPFGFATPVAEGVTRVIEVQHITKRYGRFTAVDDVSFRVEPGEILGFSAPTAPARPRQCES